MKYSSSLRRFFYRGEAAPRNGEAGFTLIEMLVVITIIGLIVGLVGPRVLNYLSESKIKTAKIQIESLSSALDLYYLDNGRYPSSNEGLEALVEKPPAASGWNGPYLKTASVPADPWGHSYVYKAPGDRAPFDIESFGSAGPEGGESAKTMITSAAR
ncbi:MAG: type II secretion system major pseudopilin GspG [Roseiarcus sp.]